MAAGPYRSVSFDQNNVITRDAVDQVTNNLQWLYENSPSARYYNATGAPMDVKSMLVGGRVRIPPNTKTDTATVKVNFPTAFAAGCVPNITTGLVATDQSEVFVVIHGPGTARLPTNLGFEVTVNVADPIKSKDKITKEFWVNWIAYGFRVDDMNEF